MSYLGVPYVWGGASPGGFDCSGLVMYAYAQIGIDLPHSSYAMANMGSDVPYDQLQPGDLVFFDGDGHVGMYIGGGRVRERAVHGRGRARREPRLGLGCLALRRSPPDRLSVARVGRNPTAASRTLKA